MTYQGKPIRPDLMKMSKVFTAFNGFCVKHNIKATNITANELFFLAFTYDKFAKEDELKINIVDTDGYPYYILDAHTLKGQAIYFEKDNTKYYDISFEEIHRLEESGECTNYGDEAEFKTYADCVAYEQEQIFKPLLGGCMVPWLAAPGSSGICKGRVQLKENSMKAWTDTCQGFSGRVQISDSWQTGACLKPCIQLQAYSTLTNQV